MLLVVTRDGNSPNLRALVGQDGLLGSHVLQNFRALCLTWSSAGQKWASSTETMKIMVTVVDIILILLFCE